MRNTISINDIFAKVIVGPSGLDEAFVEFTQDNHPDVSERFWAMLLAMAIRDHASSAHYQPWQPLRKLTYIVDGVEYILMTPPDFAAKSLIDFIRNHLLHQNSNFLEWLTNKIWSHSAKCNSITFVWEGVAVTWDLVIWSSDGRSGVDFYRVTPIEKPAISESLSTPADAVVCEA